MREGIRRLFNGIGATIAAAIGMVFYPISRFFNLTVLAIAIGIIAAIAIPFIAISAANAIRTIAPQLGLLGAAATFLVTAAALTGLIGAMLPTLFVIGTIRIAINAPFEGAKMGWNQGLRAMLSNIFSSLFKTSLNRSRNGAHLLPQDEQSGNITEITGLLAGGGEEATFQQILAHFGDMAANAARRPISEAQFNGLELTDVEFTTLKQQQKAPLSADELAQLSASDNAETQALVAQYKNLERLATDPCSILTERPDPADTILLVKQYQLDGEWLPVPNVSHIFSREWLQGNSLVNASHPINRDRLLTPSAYEVDADTTYPTRYVFHKYYPTLEEGARGVSQEENIILTKLRERLEPNFVEAPGVDLTAQRFAA